MKFNVYAVKDLKKGTYLQPFFIPFYVRTEDVLVDFGRNLKAAESVISQNSGEFELHKIGEFMDETGLFIGLPENEKLCSASDLLKEKEEDVGNTEVN